MKVCFATSECVPFIKTGGLADVSGALPKTLAKLGAEVKVFLPLYASIPVFEHHLGVASELHEIPVRIGDRTVTFNTWYGRLGDSNAEVYLIDCPTYFHRPHLYSHDGDEHERWILFQHAVLSVLQHYHWAPDVLHCHDWQAALLPVYLRKNYAWDRLFDGTSSILTIHNLGYQGKFDLSKLDDAGLSRAEAYPGGPYEFYGAFSFLKAGLVYADAISTVSEAYAREIQEPVAGQGMDGVLASRSADVFGIINGIDTDIWNPATDPHLPFSFTVEDLTGKLLNKQALLDEVRLPFDESMPVVGIISRLVHQKGFDLLQPIMSQLLEQAGIQFVVIGGGDQYIEDFFHWAAAAYPARVAVQLGYNERLAHRIEAGADMFLMPSLYEPCGLNQMYSLRYGTVPIVRKTGGLADTVRDVDAFGDDGNGFTFDDFSPNALHLTLLRAVERFGDRSAWRRITRRGMQEDFSWTASARRYLDLYRMLADRRSPTSEGISIFR